MADVDNELPEEFDEEQLDEEILDEEIPDDLEDEDVLADEDEFGLGEDLESELEPDEEEEQDDEGSGRRVTTVDEDEDDEDLVDADDVEAALDTILKERLVASEEPEDDEEEEIEVDDRGDTVDRIQPRRPGEFVCQSCFLVKHPSQLADPVRQLCGDCV